MFAYLDVSFTREAEQALSQFLYVGNARERVFVCYSGGNKSTVCNKTFFSMYYSIREKFLNYLEPVIRNKNDGYSKLCLNAVLDQFEFIFYRNIDVLITIFFFHTYVRRL